MKELNEPVDDTASLSALERPDDTLVSVVIPTRNRAHSLARALRSALAQTHAAVEVIMVDDGSEDGTPELLSTFRDQRVRYLYLSSFGNAARARNIGASVANGAYIAFLDSDDEWLPRHVERKLSVLRSRGAEGVFGGLLIEEGGRLLRPMSKPMPAGGCLVEHVFLRAHGWVGTPSLLVSAEAFSQVRFDTSMDRHEDWVFFIEFVRRFRMVHDDEPTVVVHVGSPDRMSYRLDHAANERFLERVDGHLSEPVLARIHYSLAVQTLNAEGTTPAYWRYANGLTASRHAAERPVRWAASLLRRTPTARLFAVAHSRYVRAREASMRRRRGHVRPVPPGSGTSLQVGGPAPVVQRSGGTPSKGADLRQRSSHSTRSNADVAPEKMRGQTLG